MIELLGGVLWRLGGFGARPFGKNWRRVGVPLLILVIALFHGESVYKGLLCAILSHLTLRLPITFQGDSIFDHWFNIPWLFILGYLYGIPCVIFGLGGLFTTLVPAFTVLGMTLLSNIKSTAKIFPWEACEVFFGVSVMLCYTN